MPGSRGGVESSRVRSSHGDDSDVMLARAPGGEGVERRKVYIIYSVHTYIGRGGDRLHTCIHTEHCTYVHIYRCRFHIHTYIHNSFIHSLHDVHALCMSCLYAHICHMYHICDDAFVVRSRLDLAHLTYMY